MKSTPNQEKTKRKIGRFEGLYMLAMDFLKKCTEDHVAAFGAMSAFFILLSVFPFLILLLTLTKMLPFTKDDILLLISRAISFEPTSLIVNIVNEVYRKTGTTVFTVSILTALWTSSKGVYSIVLGLNSVYDIEDNRNYFVMRLISTLYTLIFLIIVAFMMVMWVFGTALYQLISDYVPFFASVARSIIYRRTTITVLLLTFLFMCIYKFVPGRKAKFVRQLPGALLSTGGWMIVSWGCSFYMEHFHNFALIYGSMAGIMIILIWLYFCMSMIFYGAEFNYFLENKRNYHMLVRTVQPALRALKSRRVERLRRQEKDEKRRKNEQKKFRELINKLNRKDKR